MEPTRPDARSMITTFTSTAPAAGAISFTSSRRLYRAAVRWSIMPAQSAEAKKLDTFLDKFEPAIAAAARAVLAKVRDRLPGAAERVYDNTYALVIGFSPNERPSDAVFSVVVYPRYVVLYFLNGAVLPDPAGRLKGEG